VEQQTLMRVENTYRLQTKEGADWEGEYASRTTALRSDAARLTEVRTAKLRDLVEGELRTVRAIAHGVSKTPRKLDFTFGAEAPASGGPIPVWVRDEWGGVSVKSARGCASVRHEECHRDAFPASCRRGCVAPGTGGLARGDRYAQ
jgi:hypothetical protein